MEKYRSFDLGSAALAIALALGLISGACTVTGSNPSGSAGSSGGGTTGTTTGTAGTGGPSCPNGTPCGGSVVGTWNVTSSCLTLSGALDVSLVGLDPRTCKTASIAGSISVNGTWTANANGTYMDATTTSGMATIQLEAGCKILSNTPITCQGINGPLTAVGFTEANCTDNAATGGCTCMGTVDHMGSIGWMTLDPQTNGNHATSGNTLTLDGTAKYAYCVSGNQLTLTPVPSGFTASGTIVLQQSNTSGAAGTGGAAGTTGAGGMAGTTGAAGSAGGMGGAGPAGTSGTAGRGGTTGMAGTTGTAGRGGTTGAGGATAGRGGSGGTTGSAGTTGTGGSGRVEGPCDIYAAANTPCGAAYSTIRALSKNYTGPLYQVRNMSSSMNTGSGGMLKDIPQTADGFADTSVQDAFCSGTICTFSLIYDQSGNGNNLDSAPGGLSNGGMYAANDDFESSATKGVLMISGHKTYTLYMAAREGYRTPLNVKAKGVPMGNTAQGIYELADGTHYGTQCCWDFGSVSPDPKQYVTMNTLFFGTGFWGTGAPSGPWFMGDFEGGVWAGGTGASTVNNPSNPSMKVPFALGILHTPVGKYALRMANVQTATDLTTAYDGNIPSGKTWGNAGGIVLGVGGDNSNNSWGTFYEGAVTNGSPSNATDLLVMKNIQAAGYGK
ncbi:MAG TPA: arabinofuranosidase catalytic domain-containing protein [Polyangia bacterium]|nr:arabinofuranosidase catalytic domain-containing protein [Polyangia bacterium]